ncbi:MAG: methyltransferase RsmF C-terminal domain-like protein [Bacteroidota bacterium]
MTKISFPPAFEKRIHQQLGTSWDAFEQAHNEPSPVSIRLNPKKNTTPKNSTLVPWTSMGRYLSARPVFTLDPLFHGGAYYVQEASSMFLEQALMQAVDLRQPLKVLDLCAAPGGKSTHILGLIGENSLLVSNEVIRSRATILAENIQKWGCANVMVTNNDPQEIGSITGFFDVIVVDAPCSGEGLFRKDPEAITEWSAENVALCAGRQKRILKDIWPALKENGVLIYCTCTYNESENENNLSRLQQEQEIEFVDLKIDTSWGITKINNNGVVGYRCFPHQVKGEGFFLAVIRKKENEGTIRHRNKRENNTFPKQLASTLRSWLLTAEQKELIYHKETVRFIPLVHAEAMEMLRSKLKVISEGVDLGAVKHDKIIPEHALALSVDVDQRQFQSISLNLDEAIRYLRREPISVSGQKGFAMIMFENIPLGWINILSNRVNNLYPSERRIRMAPPQRSTP